MAEKKIRISGAWIGRRVEVEFTDYSPSPPGATIYVSLPGRLLNVQDGGSYSPRKSIPILQTNGWPLRGSTRGIPYRMCD